MNRDVLASIETSFQETWNEVIAFLPEVIIAILVVVVGWAVGSFFKSLVERLFKAAKLDQLLDRAEVDKLAERAGYKFRPGYFVGMLVKWFIILVFIVAALDVLRLDEVTSFFSNEVLTYLPRVIAAALILLGAFVIANLVSASVEAASRAGGFKAADLLGAFTKYAIIVFAVLAALSQLQIAPEMVQTLFAGLVFAVALAFGLAFGLGGRETAARYLGKLEGEVKSGGDHTHRP